MCAGIEVIGSALVGRKPGCDSTNGRGHQRRGAVDHCRVDNLALPGTTRFENAADQSKSEIERAAREVAKQVQRRGRRLAATAECMESSGEGDVVDVVSGRLRQRPILAPASDAAIDEARIAREAIVGAEAEPLGDAGAEPFDQPVGAFHEAQGQRLSVRGFEIDRDRPATAQQQIVAQRPREPEIAAARPVDAQHRGTHVGEQHRAHRPRPDPGQFDDLDPGKRSHGVPRLFLAKAQRVHLVRPDFNILRSEEQALE